MAIITRDGEQRLQMLHVLLRRSKRHLDFFGFLDQRVAVVPAFLERHPRHIIVTEPSSKAVGLCVLSCLPRFGAFVLVAHFSMIKSNVTGSVFAFQAGWPMMS